MTITPACHSNKVPVRESRKPWRDGSTLCYMTYEQAITMQESCLGCKHAEDKRIAHVDCKSEIEPTQEETPCGDCAEIKGEWHCTMNCYPRSVKRAFYFN